MKSLPRIIVKPAHFYQAFRVCLRNCVSVAWTPDKKTLKIDKIGGQYQLSLVPNAEGLESVNALTQLFKCLGAPLTWEIVTGDFSDEKEFNNLLLSIRRNGIAIKGSLHSQDTSTSKVPIEMNSNMMLRRSLDLHTIIVEIKSFHGLRHLMKYHKDIDVVVVRQNTEGDYTLIDHSPLTADKLTEQMRVVTRNNSVRLAEAAFSYAIRKHRRKVTCLYNPEVMPLSQSTFINAFLQTAAKNLRIDHDVIPFNTAIHNFQMNPKDLDVVVVSNLEGMIFSNCLLGMIGGPNMAAGMNIGDSAVVLEPASRTRSGDKINPTAYFLCGACLLDLLGRQDLGDVIRSGLEDVFRAKILPVDLGGKASMANFTEAVGRAVRRRRPQVLCPLVEPPKPPKSYKPDLGRLERK